ncbi:hypothetical protein [Jiangella rhizosphaerae]|uniref:Uncharacterized protein n=1 Tax=Jiangella rhizosphaerae TaxID=2293569 RepID=A0A418KS42_9ACTN|nr:hypothetical protein [Jiangella rhizosphaerae]RIQ27092.1 hypothetical protein DY240_09955 [Jiangella rhizosphaerae]
MVDDETFRALARSSPWRWRSVELTRTLVGDAITADHAVRAWIDRPGRMRVVEPDGTEHLVDETPAERGLVVVASSDGSPVEPPVVTVPLDPAAPRPVLRPDGLVAQRPSDVTVAYDDPMYENYLWVAMLDPVELSGGVDVLSVRATVLEGRDTVEAVVRPTAGYDPRCTCCALLFGEVAAELLHAEGGPEPEDRAFADEFAVALDVETGICVRLREIGGDDDGAGFDVSIAAVTPV